MKLSWMTDKSSPQELGAFASVMINYKPCKWLIITGGNSHRPANNMASKYFGTQDLKMGGCGIMVKQYKNCIILIQ